MPSISSLPAVIEFIKAFTNKEPILASEGLKWGKEGAGVVYAQVTDIQKMVVDEMRNGNQKAGQQSIQRVWPGRFKSVSIS